MGLDFGRLLRNLATGGATYFRDQRRAKKEEADARSLIGQNTEMMQGLYDRDFGQSALANLAADPLDVLAQRNAMSSMGDVANRYDELSRTGYTDLDRQALNSAFMQSRGEEQAQRQAVLAAAARRGDASGGNALLGSLMAQQGGANRANQFGTDVAIEGRRRALDALANYGQTQGQLFGMASGMRQQGVNEQVQRGGAIDAFNQWGAQQHSMDAQALANARLGQAQSMQQHAQQLQSTPNLDAGVNAYANWQTMGMAGNVTGGDAPTNGVGQIAGTNGVAAPNANSSQGTFLGGTGGGSKSMGAGGTQKAQGTGIPVQQQGYQPQPQRTQQPQQYESIRPTDGFGRPRGYY